MSGPGRAGRGQASWRRGLGGLAEHEEVLVDVPRIRGIWGCDTDLPLRKNVPWFELARSTVYSVVQIDDNRACSGYCDIMLTIASDL